MTTDQALGCISAMKLVQAFRNGEIKPDGYLQHCLQRIDETDTAINAWASLLPDLARSQLAALDQSAVSSLPLFGLPIGLKDIIDTEDLPTELGSRVFSGRQPAKDAWISARLRQHGAVIIGKTVTTEMAYMAESRTRNPANPAYGPGGSSAGSAAAVAAGHVPLAVGTQTNGSVIRPASFCGVFGFKPSRGLIPRSGVLQTSVTLDQIGFYARHLEDLALLSDTLTGHDSADPASFRDDKPSQTERLAAKQAGTPRVACLNMPYAERYTDAVHEALESVSNLEHLPVTSLPSPELFTELIEAHRLIYRYEMNQHLSDLRTGHWDELSEALQQSLLEADAIGIEQYQAALHNMWRGSQWFESFFGEYDAILTPSAPTEAPEFGTGTGDPICNTIWTLCGLPCLSLPLFSGANDLPIGIQVVAGYRQDDNALITGAKLLAAVA